MIVGQALSRHSRASKRKTRWLPLLVDYGRAWYTNSPTGCIIATSCGKKANFYAPFESIEKLLQHNDSNGKSYPQQGYDHTGNAAD